MITPTPIHLPTYATSLIGRAQEVVALSALVQQSTDRLITLVGASGSGKTRLALEVAAAVAPAFPDGVIFVGLAPVTDARFVLATIATQLDVQEQGQEPLLTTLSTSLAPKHLLLILDNMEQVQAAAPDLAHLVAAAPHLTILVTSQLALDLPTETVYPVPPLSVPADAAVRDPESVLDYSGTALFVERLRAVQPRFRLTPSSAQAVVRICQLLDGYPLAIELVAAHSATLAPEDLLLLLRNHLGVRPHQANVQVSSRTAILHPVLDWCASRLPALAKHLLLRLGVFQGGWTTAAAQAVLAPEHDLESVAEALALLAQKHLVLIETLPGHAPRYGVLDAIHDYSATRLRKQGRAVAVHTQHARYFQALAVDADTALRGPEQAAWLRDLGAEIHNLRAAMQWGLDHRDPALALTIATNLFLFWHIRAWYTEGRTWLTQALSTAPDAPPVDRATAWKVLGGCMSRQGAMADSLAAYTTSLDLYAAAGAVEGQSAVLNNIGVVYMDQGEWEKSQEVLERSIALLQTTATPNRWMLANTISNLGALMDRQGDYVSARRWTEQGLALQRQLENPVGIVTSVLNLGAMAYKTGDLTGAQTLLEESLTRSVQLGDQRNLALSWTYLGAIAVVQEQDAVAERYFAQAMEVFTTTGNIYGQTGVAVQLGGLRLLQGDYAAAATALDQAHALAIEADDQAHLLYVVYHRSALALAQGTPAAARAQLEAHAPAILTSTNRALLVQVAEVAALILQHDPATQALAVQLWQLSQAVRAAWDIPLSPRDARWAAAHGSDTLAAAAIASGAATDSTTLRTHLGAALGVPAPPA